jgi:hypothetical protein
MADSTIQHFDRVFFLFGTLGEAEIAGDIFCGNITGYWVDFGFFYSYTLTGAKKSKAH